MTRIRCGLCLFPLILTSVTLGAGREVNSHSSRFSGSTILVKYVAGTDEELSLGKLGCLLTDRSQEQLIFVPYEKQGSMRRLWGFTIHLANPSWEKDGRCSGKPRLTIPFREMKTLARGQVQSMGQPGGGSFQWITTVVASGGVVAGITSSASKTAKIWIGSVAGVIAFAGAASYLNGRTQNYITIFYDESPTVRPKFSIQSKQITREFSKPGTAAGATPKTNPKDPNGSDGPPPSRDGLPLSKETVQVTDEPSLFCKCKKVAVFQVIDPHDYWNTSMFLDAMTGLTFVQESAAQGESSGGSGGSSSGSGPSGSH